MVVIHLWPIVAVVFCMIIDCKCSVAMSIILYDGCVRWVCLLDLAGKQLLIPIMATCSSSRSLETGQKKWLDLL